MASLAHHSTRRALRRLVSFALAAGIGAALAPLPAAAAGLKAVSFDVEPVELPQTSAMRAKLKAISDLGRQVAAGQGLTIVDTTPQAKAIADHDPLSQCNGCDQDIARALGAQVEITTAMQRISAVTYSLSGSVKDVKSGRVLRQAAVDVRGDGADEWNHGIKFLIKDRLLDPPLPKDAEGLASLVASAPKSAD